MKKTENSCDKSTCPFCDGPAEIISKEARCRNDDCGWHQTVDELTQLHAGYLRTLLAATTVSIAVLAGLFTFNSILTSWLSHWNSLTIKVYGGVIFLGMWFILVFFVSFDFVLYRQIVSIERLLGWSTFIERLFVKANNDSVFLCLAAEFVIRILRNKENTSRLFIFVLVCLLSLLVVYETILFII
jgi:hypothetical protein